MKLKTFIAATGVATLAIATYSVRSQMTPSPLRAFVVTCVMTSPQNGSPYLETYTKAFAVRPDGSWVMITYLPNVGTADDYIRDIYDVTLGIHTTVEDLTKSIQTRAMTP